jgi:uncharacterized membrane protein
MSIRDFRSRHSGRSQSSRRQTASLYILLGLTIASEIAYPLTQGENLRIVTLVTVYLGAATMAIHSLFSFGPRYFFTLVPTTLLFGWGIEELGIHTGWPFGHYHYDPSLGIAIAGIPLVVPCAWLMLTHPILIAARKLTRQWVFLVGGYGLMAWDLFLDPQMVRDGRWRWKISGPHIPLESQIPLSNALGWLLSGIILMGALHWLLPKERKRSGVSSRICDFFLIWTFISGIIGNLFFFHMPGVALMGGIAFSVFLGPYLFRVQFGRPDFL